MVQDRVARFPNEAIAGQRITYGFGLAIVSGVGSEYIIKFSKNGSAMVAVAWYRKGDARRPPIKNDPNRFDELDARIARGRSTKRPTETGKEPKGSHREQTGYLEVDATVSVVAPRQNVAHLSRQIFDSRE